MGFLSFLSDAADAVSDAIDDTANSVARAIEEVADAVDPFVDQTVSFIGQSAAGVGGIVADVAGKVDAASGGTFGRTLELLDDTAFDAVDFVTGGLIDVDFDNGDFTASAGIDGIFGGSVLIGESGLAVSGDNVPLFTGSGFTPVSFDASVTDDGLALGIGAGVDFGPLPFVDAHLEFSPEGDISIGGEIQATIPTPKGIVAGSGSGGFVRTDDGFAAAGDLDVTFTAVSGTRVGAGISGNVSVEADGDTSFGLGRSLLVGQVGLGDIEVETGFQHTEDNGTVVNQLDAAATATGFGMSVNAGVANTSAQGADGTSFRDTDVTGGFKGLDADSILQIGSQLLGAAGVELPVDAEGLVGAVGSDGLSGLFGALGDQGLTGDFLAGLGDGTLGEVLGGLAGNGALDGVLGALGPGATSDLIGRLVSNAASSVVSSAVDGVVGAVLDPIDEAVAEFVDTSLDAQFSASLDTRAGNTFDTDVATRPGGAPDAGEFQPAAAASSDQAEVVVEVAPEPESTQLENELQVADDVSVSADALFDDL
jgi:hypothetical protein